MTNTAKHTPGPSDVMAYFDLSDEQWDILPNSVVDRLTEIYMKETAAPAMYEALQIMVRAANVDEIDPLVMFASIERARHVLKLAEGKSA